MSDQDETPREIVPAPVVLPAVTPEEALQAWRQFLEIKQKLLDDEDYQTIAGKPFTKKSGFRKLALAYNLSDRIIEQVRTDREDGSFTWRVVTEAEAPNGRVCTGVGVCDSRERGYSHVEHDVYSTAHTRSKSRAFSDMLAGGIVSAEEMGVSSNEASTSRDPPPIIDEATILDALDADSLNTENLKITVTDQRIIVSPTKFLGTDVWDKYNQALWKAGLDWIKDGKNSRWEGGIE